MEHIPYNQINTMSVVLLQLKLYEIFLKERKPYFLSFLFFKNIFDAGSHCVSQADPPVSASVLLGVQLYTTMPGFIS